MPDYIITIFCSDGPTNGDQPDENLTLPRYLDLISCGLNGAPGTGVSLSQTQEVFYDSSHHPVTSSGSSPFTFSGPITSMPMTLSRPSNEAVRYEGWPATIDVVVTLTAAQYAAIVPNGSFDIQFNYRGVTTTTGVLAGDTNTGYIGRTTLIGPGVLVPVTTGPPLTATESASLALDAHRRPLAATGSVSGSTGTISGLWSKDAGHTFSSSTIASGADPNLIVDTRTNRFNLIYTASGGISRAFGSVADGFPQDTGSPTVISGLSGKFPICARPPSDRDYVLMAYQGSAGLMSAYSLDCGATWTALSTIVAGLDMTNSGRPGLCFLGELAIVVYGSGNNLLCQTSLDRGKTWRAAVTIGSAGPYSGLSLLGWQGRLYLLCWTTSGSTQVPALMGSSELGATWSAVGGSLPTLSPPTGLGVFPQSGILRLGTTNYSADDAATWPTD